MINPFKIKKYTALIMSSFISVIMFFIGFIYYGFGGALIFMIPGMILGIVIGNFLLRTPFTDMLEGRGILTFNIDSTGVIIPFLIKVASNSIYGKLRGKQIDDVFDRGSVGALDHPREVSAEAEQVTENGEDKHHLVIKITKEEYNKGRFALFHWPVLIYNEQIGSIITKDMLGETEKAAFAEHSILHLNRKVEELNNNVRDFGRYVIESIKPKSGFNVARAAGWAIIIILIGLLILFAPNLLKAFGGAGSAASGAVGNAIASGATIARQ